MCVCVCVANTHRALPWGPCVLTNILFAHNPLQHTATHCNTLHHTVIYLHTLQHTVTHCNTLQHTATTYANTHTVLPWGSCFHTSIVFADVPLQHTATDCNSLQHTATHCNTLQHTATHCNTLQHTRRDTRTAKGCTTLQRLGDRTHRDIRVCVCVMTS